MKSDGKQELLLASTFGQAVRFNESDARPIGRTSRGVRGINLKKGDSVVDMRPVQEGEQVLTITENGYGKQTPITEYRLINRGGKGVRNILCTEKNGNVAGVRAVSGNEDLLLISKKGIIIRTATDQISSIGRNTQGVRVMRLGEGDTVTSIAKLLQDEESI